MGGRRKKSFDRPRGTLPKQALYVIATEGEKTEKIYFNGLFKRKNIQIEVINHKTKSSPNQVIKLLNRYKHDKDAGAGEMWLVIDRDDWPHDSLASVEAECKRKGYNFIISDPCFELWLLLHQEKPKTPMTTKACQDAITSLLPNYTKSKYDVEQLRPYIGEAIKYGQNLDNGETPYTKVYELVDQLTKHE